jgi:glycine/D-amino acid oxidase-like deaminating enzyme
MNPTRRTWLATSVGALAGIQGGLALAAVPSPGRHVTVVGAGIIGASIAYHLAAAGAKVTVLEQQTPGAGATMNSFAWLNAGGKRPRPYHLLNQLGVMGWHRLQSEIGKDALPIQWGGRVEWRADAAEAKRMLDAVTLQQSWGYPTRLIDAAEFRRLLPGATPGEIALASYCSVEGAADPLKMNLAILKAAERLGAKIEFPATVQGFEGGKDRVRRVLTSQGPLITDDVVLAAGLGSEALARMLDANVPLRSTPGVLAHSEPAPIRLSRLAMGPGVELKQSLDGRFVTGPGGGGLLKDEATREVGQELLAMAARYLPAIARSKLDYVTLGHRVLPKDGFPIIGRLPTRRNVYVASMHSGMTQAPIVGQLAAIEILGEQTIDFLETFRPERFA